MRWKAMDWVSTRKSPSGEVGCLLFSLTLCSAGLLGASGKAPVQPDSGQTFEPTGALLLSTDSPTKDEDPSVIRAQDGTLFVAWFSDRGGNADIYITNTANGTDWSSPVRITTSSHGDFYPNLYQDEQGTFHLTWFQWVEPFLGQIRYNTSPDGLTWDEQAEEAVTTEFGSDDWVPTITQAPDGTLLVYFVSDKRDAVNPTNEIYVVTKRPTEDTWDSVVPVADINNPTEHDHLPFAARTGDEITLVWVRYDASEALPWLNPRSDIFYATSSDGLNWSATVNMTNVTGNVVNLFPALYPSLDGEWSLVWLSSRLGQPRVFELPLADIDRYPAAVVENTTLGPGYSHRIAATSTPGVYIGVWVQGEDGVQDIYYRFFEK